MMTVFLDLDGTLVDVRPRYYELYRSLADELRCSALSEECYSRLKRHNASLEDLLPESNHHECLYFRQRWVEDIEDSKYLLLDRLFPGVLDALEDLRSRHGLVLATLRRKKDELREELARLGLIGFFNRVLVPPTATGEWQVKMEMVRNELGTCSGSNVVVGDTEGEIFVARTVGALAVAVTSGLRSPEYLAGFQPDLLIDSVAALNRYL